MQTFKLHPSYQMNRIHKCVTQVNCRHVTASLQWLQFSDNFPLPTQDLQDQDLLKIYNYSETGISLCDILLQTAYTLGL